VDFSAFSALAESCAPHVDIRPLIEIVRVASGFEPLSLTISGRKPIKILATSKDEAIALAMQAKVGKQDVRLGLVGLTFADLDKAGISIADAFESCPSLGAAAQILYEDPAHLAKSKAGANSKTVGASLLREFGHQEEQPTPQDRSTPAERDTSKKRWDVFGGGSGKSLLVYDASPLAR
jgi:type IV secretion system protein VirB1